ncbi:MAG: hypothetical protein RBR53_09535 [Desulforegulaceae bacterium]|nr:hypothetical protein [Desulforegulaceae bacterium]
MERRSKLVFVLFFIVTCFSPLFLYSNEIVSPEYEKGNFFYYTSTGIINSHTYNYFVISDQNFKKSRAVSFHGMKFRHISPSEFTKGSFVGYKLNKNMELTDIYLIKKN